MFDAKGKPMSMRTLPNFYLVQYACLENSTEHTEAKKGDQQLPQWDGL